MSTESYFHAGQAIAEDTSGERASKKKNLVGLTHHEEGLAWLIAFNSMTAMGIRQGLRNRLYVRQLVNRKMHVSNLLRGLRTELMWRRLSEAEKADPNLANARQLWSPSLLEKQRALRQKLMEQNQGSPLTEEQHQELDWASFTELSWGKNRVGISFTEEGNLRLTDFAAAEMADATGSGLTLIDYAMRFAELGKSVTRSAAAASGSETAMAGVEALIFCADHGYQIGQYMEYAFLAADKGRAINPIAQAVERTGAWIDATTGAEEGTWASAFRGFLEQCAEKSKAAGNAANVVLDANEALAMQAARMAYGQAQMKVSEQHRAALAAGDETAPRTPAEWSWRTTKGLITTTLEKTGEYSMDAIIRVSAIIGGVLGEGGDLKEVLEKEGVDALRLAEEETKGEGEGEELEREQIRQFAETDNFEEEGDGEEAEEEEEEPEEVEEEEAEEEYELGHEWEEEEENFQEMTEIPEPPPGRAPVPKSLMSERLTMGWSALGGGVMIAGGAATAAQIGETWTGKRDKGWDKASELIAYANAVYLAGEAAKNISAGTLMPFVQETGLVMGIFAAGVYAATTIAEEHRSVADYEKPDFGNSTYNTFRDACHTAWVNAQSRHDMQDMRRRFAFGLGYDDNGHALNPQYTWGHDATVDEGYWLAHKEYNSTYVDHFGKQGTKAAKEQFHSDLREAYSQMYEDVIGSRQPPVARDFYTEYMHTPEYTWNSMYLSDENIGEMIESCYKGSMKTYTDWTTMKSMYGMKQGSEAFDLMQSMDADRWYAWYGKSFATEWYNDTSVDSATGYVGRGALDFSEHDEIGHAADGQITLHKTYAPRVISGMLSFEHVSLEKEGIEEDGFISFNNLYYLQAKEDWHASDKGIEARAAYTAAMHSYMSYMDSRKDLWGEYDNMEHVYGDGPYPDWMTDELATEEKEEYLRERSAFEGWVRVQDSGLEFYGDSIGWSSSFYFQLIQDNVDGMTEEERDNLEAAYQDYYGTDTTFDPAGWLKHVYIPELESREHYESTQKPGHGGVVGPDYHGSVYGHDTRHGDDDDGVKPEDLEDAAETIENPDISNPDYYVATNKRGGQTFPKHMIQAYKKSRHGSGQGTSHVLGNQASGEDMLRSVLQILVEGELAHRALI